MGNSSTRKESAQPKKLMPSGEATVGPGMGSGFSSDGNSTIDELRFHLNNIDSKIVDRTFEGDSVTVIVASLPFPVMTQLGRIGDVPEEFEKRIRAEGYLSGFVARIVTDPYRVQVVLRK